MPFDQFSANRPNEPSSPIDIASRPSPRSPVSSSRDNVVPQMTIRSPRLRPGKFVLVDAKRVLQQYPLNNGHSPNWRLRQLCANRRHCACTPLDNFLGEDLAFTRKGQSEHDFSCWRAPRPPRDAMLAHVAMSNSTNNYASDSIFTKTSPAMISGSPRSRSCRLA
jgi:hypothetical protein